MAVRAYSQMYVEDAMEILAQAFDFVVHGCQMNLDEFLQVFSATKVASNFENGNPKYVTGMSGIELVYHVWDKSGRPLAEIEYTPTLDRSPEYWAGWVLAYYQWYTGKSIHQILDTVPLTEILRLYPTLHEADISKFVDVMEGKSREQSVGQRLQEKRKNAGFSQSQLAEASGVSLRSIQMYEQDGKDLRKAQAERVLAIARKLGCNVEDLV